MPILRLYWLGSPVIEVDGRSLRLEMRKTLALLAYLSLSPQSPSRETLATMFWPEFDQQHALTNLRVMSLKGGNYHSLVCLLQCCIQSWFFGIAVFAAAYR